MNITNTSLNEMCCVHLMTHVKTAITKAFAELYYGKVNMLDIPANIEENFLVFDSSDETKFSRHFIIPGVHVENHMEAKAFADEVVKNLDAKFRPVIDLGVYKSLQNFCLYMNHKVGSNNINQAHLELSVTCSLDISLKAILSSLLSWASQKPKPLILTLS